MIRNLDDNLGSLDFKKSSTINFHPPPPSLRSPPSASRAPPPPAGRCGRRLRRGRTRCGRRGHRGPGPGRGSGRNLVEVCDVITNRCWELTDTFNKKQGKDRNDMCSLIFGDVMWGTSAKYQQFGQKTIRTNKKLTCKQICNHTSLSLRPPTCDTHPAHTAGGQLVISSSDKLSSKFLSSSSKALLIPSKSLPPQLELVVETEWCRGQM
jgi:hypothetical protein